jgi:hypothetical protein
MNLNFNVECKTWDLLDLDLDLDLDVFIGDLFGPCLV